MEGDSRRHRSERRLSPISIHSLRMEGDCIIEFSKHNFNISIHSLHTEGDRLQLRRRQIPCHFNPLPPHGGRLAHDILEKAGCLFQSTPSAWRETQMLQDRWRLPHHFNPLPPHGGRLYYGTDGQLYFTFQSTPSAWRETFKYSCTKIVTPIISIHSLRMEGDDLPCHRSLHPTHFNPLPPHGGRPQYANVQANLTEFQSTPSAWRETRMILGTPWFPTFQSTPSAWRETTLFPDS